MAFDVRLEWCAACVSLGGSEDGVENLKMLVHDLSVQKMLSEADSAERLRECEEA